MRILIGWTGSFHSMGPDEAARESTAMIFLTENGIEIRTAEPGENKRHLVLKGKIEGNKITLEAEDEKQAVHLDLVLAADRITGDMSMVRSGQVAKIEVTGAKEMVPAGGARDSEYGDAGRRASKTA